MTSRNVKRRKKISIDDGMDVCRGCLAPAPFASQPLFGGSPCRGEALAAAAGVSVAPGDGLPDRLCASCADRLRDACDFFSACREADRELRRLRVERESSVETSARSRFECDACGRAFKRKNDLVVHRRTHTGEKPFACDYCPARFAQSGSLAEHRRVHTGETPYACDVCDRTFANRSSYWRHGRVHTKERPYSCDECGKSFSHGSSLKHHALVHSDDRPYACDACGKTVKSKYALRQHLIVHAEKKAYVCERCGKDFTSKAHLDKHIEKMHAEGAGRCALCRRDASNLAEHMLRHADAPHYCCHLCGRKYKQRSALTYHVGFHTNADKYKCEEEGCDRTFPKRNMLEFHTRKVHRNIAPHVCKFCSKAFFRNSDLTRHVNTLHSDDCKVDIVVKCETISATNTS